ncbi:MAG: helix-turn-helix transcriptional regulator [Planctomycetes bacterium]|nr:helix-turn-helix transcriptional regulator [Planctomycetota bacterium]
MEPTPTSHGGRMAALKAIASPVRQELISEIGHGGASARELAERLGRSRQALHFHLGALERAGLVRVIEERGTGREAERVYAIAPDALKFTASQLSAREWGLAARATRSMLRLTSREFDAAAERGELVSESGKPMAMALRAKARLDEAGRERFHRLIREMMDLFRAAKGKNSSERMLAVTVVLTPARESGGSKKKSGPKTKATGRRS